MIIQFGGHSWKLTLSFAAFILIFATNDLILDFFIKPEQQFTATRDILTGLGLIVSLLILPKLDKFLKIWLFVSFLYLVYLFLESYYNYNTFFRYPHVFGKLTEVFIIPFGYVFFRNKSPKFYRNAIAFLVIVFLANLIILKPYVFSFSSFLDTERGVGAGTTFILVLPAVYLFNQYMAKNKGFTLLVFFIVLGLIIFLQHRSVWMATLAAFAINFILVKKKADFSIRNSAIVMMFLVPLIFSFIFSSLILSKNPEVVEKFKERIEDINKVDEQGTGNWRLKQAESYVPFIKKHLLFGMRFDGFELPIQFYQTSTGNVYFEDYTGHHFHSYYVDALFYLGLFGLLLKLLPTFYAIWQGFKKPALNLEQISFISFIASSLIYGLAYDFSTYQPAVVGITLGLLVSTMVKDKNTDIESEILRQKTLVS